MPVHRQRPMGSYPHYKWGLLFLESQEFPLPLDNWYLPFAIALMMNNGK